MRPQNQFSAAQSTWLLSTSESCKWLIGSCSCISTAAQRFVPSVQAKTPLQPMNFRTYPTYPNHSQPIYPLHPPAKDRTFTRLLNSRQGLGHLNSSTCGPKFREAQSQPADRLHWPGSWRLNRLNRMQQTQHDSTQISIPRHTARQTRSPCHAVAAIARCSVSSVHCPRLLDKS